MRREPVDFRDVRDPAGFVQGTISKWQRPNGRRGPIILSLEEREELFAEGMAILCKLAVDFDEWRDGYDQAGRFSGYAAMYLPRKLGDAWHRLHPEHQQVTQPDGRRRWEYRERAVSLEAVTEDDPERSGLLADRRVSENLRPRLFAALVNHWTGWLEVVAEVGELLSMGATDADCAAMLGITPEMVKEAKDAIQPVIAALQSEDS